MSTISSDPAAAPPSPELSQQAMDGLLHLFAAMRSNMRDVLRDGADMLAPMHLRLLKHCQQHPGASQQTLVQASGRDKGQIARLVKDLEGRGMLLREADPHDGRSQRLQLTAAGQAACQRFAQHESAIAQRLFAPMSAGEVKNLIDQLAVLRDRLRWAQEARTLGES